MNGPWCVPTAHAGAAAAVVCHLVLYIPWFFLGFRYASLGYPLKMAVSLDNQFTMALGCVMLSKFEGIGQFLVRFFRPIHLQRG